MAALLRPKVSVPAVVLLLVMVPAPESWLMASEAPLRSNVEPAAIVKVEKSGITLDAPRNKVPPLRVVAPV